MDPDLSDTTYLVEFAYLLREQYGTSAGRVRHTSTGCSGATTGGGSCKKVGFDTQVRVDSYGRDLFIAMRPGGE